MLTDHRMSIPIIYALATRTTLLGDDPILWFAMMLMPCGPPALKLTALADVAGAEEQERMAIAKFLTVSTVSLLYHCMAWIGFDAHADIIRRITSPIVCCRRSPQSVVCSSEIADELL